MTHSHFTEEGLSAEQILKMLFKLLCIKFQTDYDTVPTKNIIIFGNIYSYFSNIYILLYAQTIY